MFFWVVRQVNVFFGWWGRWMFFFGWWGRWMFFWVVRQVNVFLGGEAGACFFLGGEAGECFFLGDEAGECFFLGGEAGECFFGWRGRWMLFFLVVRQVNVLFLSCYLKKIFRVNRNDKNPGSTTLNILGDIYVWFWCTYLWNFRWRNSYFTLQRNNYGIMPHLACPIEWTKLEIYFEIMCVHFHEIFQQTPATHTRTLLQIYHIIHYLFMNGLKTIAK